MRKKRDRETPEERTDRVHRSAQAREQSRAADEDAIDAMVKRNIEQQGP
jgi:hypothetical protein